MKVKRVVCTNKQQVIDITADGKRIRLDVYLEDEENTIYDIEMQTTRQKDLPKRSRYYQRLIDLNLIEKGSKYKELKKSYVIFICLSDPFGEGLHVYHFSQKCQELPDLELGDDAYKVFLNVAGTKNDISSELKAFLSYLVDANKTDTPFTKALDVEVNKAKKHEEWKVEYMTLLMRDQENQEIGKLKTLAEDVQLGEKTIERAAERASMSIAEFEQFMLEQGYKIPELI